MENNIENENPRLLHVNIEKEMKDSFMQYSMSVIVSRALPDVRDGLKPVHRRILYTMHENGLVPSKAYRKCADTVGSVLGRYHPHGDVSVYDALVRLAQNFSMRYPLIDGHGNFGSVDGDPAAAYRYTEARMSKISLRMLTDIDKDTINYHPNYDDRLQEPEVLPARYPNLLVNGSTGIAVGMATNIPPHNLGEVIDGMCYLIDNPDCELNEICEHIKGPDFPTGGIIMGRSGIRAAYATGRGKITLRGRAEIQEEKNGKFRIVITEIPYMVNKARLQENIADLVKDKKIDGISAIRDESDKDGMHVVIELRRDANPQVVLNKLYTFTQLQDTFGVIMLALVDGVPKTMGLIEVLQHYIKFQIEVITRRTKFDLKKAEERAHILEGLRIALDFIDEVIAILRGSKSIPEGKEKLIERFGLSEVQADYVVNMTLGKLTGLERQKIDDELAALIETIKALNEILNNEDKILQIIKEESLEIKEKFDNPRRSEIAAVSGEVDIEDLIPQEDCVLTYTHFGYIKRQPVDVYKIQKRGGRGVSGLTRRDEDFVTELFVCSSHDYVMFFSTKGKVYRLKCYEIPEGSRVSRGTNIINLLPLEEDEKISSMIKISEYNEGNYLVMVTRKGIIKRTDVTAYDTARKGGLKAITIDEDDELAWVRLTDGNSNLIIGTKLGRAIKFNENDARPLSRTARGVKAITLSKNDEVVGMERVRENATILTVTEKGQGRKTELDQYRLQSRGGKGITNYKITEKSGIVAGIKIIDENDDAIMITDEGVIIRIHSKDINTLSRYASGVRVMRVGENTKIVTVAKAEHEDEIDSEEEICETDETTADIDENVENIEKTDADTIIQTNGENVSE